MRQEILYEGKYKRFIRKRGWEFTERVNCSGIVVILAMTEEKKILVIEQYRVPVGKNVIEFPAGLVDDGHAKSNESFEEAARRELLEETGYEAEKLTYLMSGPSSQASLSDILTIFVASGLKKVSAPAGDGTEEITVHEVGLEEADQWLSRKAKEGCLIDPKIYAGLYWFSKSIPSRQPA